MPEVAKNREGNIKNILFREIGKGLAPDFFYSNKAGAQMILFAKKMLVMYKL